MGLMRIVYGNKVEGQSDDDTFNFEDFTEEITKRVIENLLDESPDEEDSLLLMKRYRIIPQPSNDKIMILNEITDVSVNPDGTVIFSNAEGVTYIVSPTAYSTIFSCDEDGKPVNNTGWF